MPSKQQKKRKYHKDYKAKRANVGSDKSSGESVTEGKALIFFVL